MAINKNHEFEELDGIKCAIVEKNASAERVAFLKSILAYNRYTVIVVPSQPAKVAPVATAPVEGQPLIPAPAATETFTVGVTDLTFNPINAIFGRLLKAPGGHVVTQAYWQQKEKEPHEEVPYYEFGK
ncbi:MAG: hypothetical protein V4717_01230 [Bacteroidota bacterium]